MKRCLLFFFYFFLLITANQLFSQNIESLALNDILRERGEAYFKFQVNSPLELMTLTKVISIDRIQGNEVFAYANKMEMEKFIKLGYSFTLLKAPSLELEESELNMGASSTDFEGKTIWNFYPTYQQYLDFMAGFATAHPSICRLDTIGTSEQGRLLLTVKISDSVQYERGKPQFFYTSSIHGDELTGYVLMLHLIDYLLSNYGLDPRITEMVNNTQIYINPLANPDGTFHGGNNTVYGATRYNANNIDLNRNFPDPADGPHPDGYAWQQETVNFMNFADSNHFTMSMNFHGGSEVFNYPWDTWAKLHADNSWWDYLGREYADTVHKYGPSNYFKDMDNGVTNGYAWYRITGGRQDYNTYFQHGREVTLEISTIKTPPANTLPNFWTYNYRSFLNYIEQANYGINGQVTDSITGNPIAAQVYIFNHDFDNSFVYSNLPSGWYFRPIDQGSYNVTFSASGYRSKTVKDVVVNRLSTTRLNVQLASTTSQIIEEKNSVRWEVSPNPSTGKFSVQFEKPLEQASKLTLLNGLGQIVYQICLNRGDSKSLIEVTGLTQGLYQLRCEIGDQLFVKKVVIE